MSDRTVKKTDTQQDTRKPFDFEKWKAGAKVETHDGMCVNNLTYFENVNEFALAGEFDGWIETWTREGFAYRNPGSSLDLVMVPVKRKIEFFIDKSTGQPVFIVSKNYKEQLIQSGYKIHTVEVEE